MYICSGNCLDIKICDKIDGGCRICVFGWKGYVCNKSRNMVNMKLDLKGMIKQLIFLYSNFKQYMREKKNIISGFYIIFFVIVFL